MIGVSPIRLNAFAEMYGPTNRSGARPSSLTFIVCPLYPPRPLNARLPVR